MYKCPECGSVFEEPEYETVCFEELYGVGSMFADRHYGTFASCPKCGGSIDIEYDTWDEEYDDENDE
jgi:NMD protein affecting ribosome stability and mRNA decay